MKNIYSITFCLFFGLILLSIPQAYSVANADEVKKQAFFEYAMQAYSSKTPTQNPNGYTITAKEALAKIKTELLLPSTVCQLLVSGYIREDFTAHNKNCPDELTSLILCFLVKPYQDKESTKKILGWAVKNAKGYDFITDYLEEVRNSFTAYHYFSHLKDILGDHQLNIYAHKDNFVNKKFVLWLTKKLKWDVPTDKKIENYQALHNSPITQHFILSYKCKMVRAFATENIDFYNELCYHLLNGAILLGIVAPSRLQGVRSAKDNFLKQLNPKHLADFSKKCRDNPDLSWYTVDGDARQDTSIEVGFCLTGVCFWLLLTGTIPYLANIILL